MRSFDQLRQIIANVIAEEREHPSIPGSADLAGLTEDEWTADRILREIKDHYFEIV